MTHVEKIEAVKMIVALATEAETQAGEARQGQGPDKIDAARRYAGAAADKARTLLSALREEGWEI